MEPFQLAWVAWVRLILVSSPRACNSQTRLNAIAEGARPPGEVALGGQTEIGPDVDQLRHVEVTVFVLEATDPAVGTAGLGVVAGDEPCPAACEQLHPGDGGLGPL